MKNKVLSAGAVLGCLLWLLPASGQCQQPGQASAGWPEVPTVQDWLAQELRETRALGRTPSERPASETRPRTASAAARAIELLAVYGIDEQWAVQVRIGGHTHMLRPAGPGSADDARGKDSIVADQFEGRCLRLRYRNTSRRLCLPASGAPSGGM